jgi:hypothetical protein
MTVIKFRPRFDHDPAELLLTRIAHHLWLERRRALRESDVQDVHSIDAALHAVGELLQLVKQENAASWKQCKAA